MSQNPLGERIANGVDAAMASQHLGFVHGDIQAPSTRWPSRDALPEHDEEIPVKVPNFQIEKALDGESVAEIIRDSVARAQKQFTDTAPPANQVQHPAHYGGGDNPYEVIKVAEAWEVDKDAYLFNVVKYVARAGKKNPGKELEDLRKARFYLDRRINQMENNND